MDKDEEEKREQYPAILTEQTWLIKDWLYGRENFFFRDQSGKITPFFRSSPRRWRAWERTLVPEAFLEIFLRERESEPRSSEEREKNVFFSLSSPPRDSLSPLRGSLLLSRRKISRKTLVTRVLGTRLSGKFLADETGPFSLRQPIRTQHSLHLAISRNQPCNIQIIRFTAVQD